MNMVPPLEILVVMNVAPDPELLFYNMAAVEWKMN